MQKLLAIPAALTIALALGACNQGQTPPSSGLTSDQQNDISNAAISATETSVNTMTVSDSASLNAANSSGLAPLALSCISFGAGSTLDGSGKPVKDVAGVPVKAIYVFNNCSRIFNGGLGKRTLNGQLEVDGSSTQVGNPIYKETLGDGSFAASIDPAKSLVHAYSDVQWDGGASISEGLNGVRNNTRADSSSLTKAHQVTHLFEHKRAINGNLIDTTWVNGDGSPVVYTFTASTAGTLDQGKPLPAGTITLSGPRSWARTIKDSSGTVLKTEQFWATVSTPTPLQYDPSCTGSSNIRSGVYVHQLYSDAARTTLVGTMTVTYADCTPTAVFTR